MAGVGAEVRERHPVAAADARVELVDLAGEAVRREPLGHGIGVEEGAVDLLGLGAKDAVKANGVGHDHLSLFFVLFLSLTPVPGENHRPWRNSLRRHGSGATATLSHGPTRTSTCSLTRCSSVPPRSKGSAATARRAVRRSSGSTIICSASSTPAAFITWTSRTRSTSSGLPAASWSRRTVSTPVTSGRW